MTTVALLPLDDRPVNYDDVALLAAAAGAEVLLPPRELLPPEGVPADTGALVEWIQDTATTADVAVVNVNQLLYGGYVASRRTSEPVGAAVARLEVVRELGRTRPVHAYMTLMRTKQSDGAGAEPYYWQDHGAQLFRLSTEYYRREHGAPDAADEARADIPAEHVADYLVRRLRLHTVQLALLELAAEGVIDTLSILVEDSTPESFSTSEREWLTRWVDRLDVPSRVQCLPGADEAGGSLLIRALSGAGPAPRIAVLCADCDALDRVALYEDVPVGRTVAQQIDMIGARLVHDLGEADLVLAVHPPAEPSRDWYEHPQTRDGAAAGRLADLVREHLDAGRVVTVADVADANGAAPELVEALRARGALTGVAGFAGWNTAGNSIGSALAQGLAHLLSSDDSARKAQRQLLLRRLLDDWAYQSGARREVLARPHSDIGEVEEQMRRSLGDLGEVGAGWSLVPGSVRWPWDRPFEVSFDLAEMRELR